MQDTKGYLNGIIQKRITLSNKNKENSSVGLTQPKKEGNGKVSMSHQQKQERALKPLNQSMHSNHPSIYISLMRQSKVSNNQSIQYQTISKRLANKSDLSLNITILNLSKCDSNITFAKKPHKRIFTEHNQSLTLYPFHLKASRGVKVRRPIFG